MRHVGGPKLSVKRVLNSVKQVLILRNLSKTGPNLEKPQ